MYRYYNGESASKLIREFKVSTYASNLYKLFPPEVYENYTCEFCNSPLVISRPSKSMKDAPKLEKNLYCPICKHRPYYSGCRCKHCIEKEQHLKAEQLKIIEETYSKVRIPVDFNELSFKSKVF